MFFPLRNDLCTILYKFQCTIQWFDICVHCKMITTRSLVTICYYTKLIKYWLYSQWCILHPHDLFQNWRFVLLDRLHSFCPYPQTLSFWATTNLFFVSISLDFFVCFVFLDSTHKRSQVGFVFLCLTDFT